MITFPRQAPLTLANNSPMELLHQIFVKLGARYVVITDTDGLCASRIFPCRTIVFDDQTP
jgi:chloride channel 3/4/5